MNKMLVAILDNEKAADAGTHASRNLHDEGDITIDASAVISRGAKIKASVKEAAHRRGVEQPGCRRRGA